jgi:hypothetical protein
MASADRAMAKVIEHYRSGVGRFVAAGLAPPVDFISSGVVAIPEGVPVLLDLHKSITHRVSVDTDRSLPKAVRKVGEAAVRDAMRVELSRIYGVDVGEFERAEAMYRQVDILEPDQPRAADGDYDFDPLRSESVEHITRYAGAAPSVTALGYAPIGDPRLSRRLALTGSVPGRLVWASMLRPHEVEELHFADLRIIWRDSGRWRFDFLDWRSRSFGIEERGEWDGLMEAVREESAKAGLVWKVPYEGKRPT